MQIKNVRFIIAAITTFSAYAVYVSRVNLSIAIIAMVDDHHGGDHNEQSKAAQAPPPPPPPPTGNNSSMPPTLAMAEAKIKLIMEVNEYLKLSPSRNNGTNSAAGSTSNSSAAASQGRSHANVFVKSKNSFKTPLISQEKFHWDQTEQGHILGAFFYGYILFQIPGARMAESVGARWIIMAASAGSAVISLAFPLSTQLNSIHLLMVLRFVMGLCQSAFFPAAYCLFCRWLPERERSVLLPIMFIGSNMGSISTYIMSSYLISSSYGWPSVFYLSGWVCLLCSILWGIFGSNGPEDNWWISAEERKMIVSNVNNQSSESASLNADDDGSNKIDDIIIDDQSSPFVDKQTSPKTGQIQTSAGAATNKISSNSLSLNSGKASAGGKSAREPTPDPSWSKLICSIPVWTLILSMYGNEWSNVVLCYELPTYLNTALSYPIEQNGVINSFFQLSYTVASPIMSSLGAYMLDNHPFGMRKVHVRKLFQSLATFGQLACFVSVPICGANRGLIMMFMFLAIVFKACANAGDIMVSGDLSPEYAGTIFAFANSIGNTAGFFVPLLAAAFVGEPYDRVQWTPFWLTSAAIMCFSGLIFLVFGETRRQDFSKDPPKEKEKKEIKCRPSEAMDLSNLTSKEIRADVITDNNNNNNITSPSDYHHHRRRQEKTTSFYS